MIRVIGVWLMGFLVALAAGPAIGDPATRSPDRAESTSRISLGPVHDLFAPRGPCCPSAHWSVPVMTGQNKATVGFTANSAYSTADLPGPILETIAGDDQTLFLDHDENPPLLASDQNGNLTALWLHALHDPETGDVLGPLRMMTSYRSAGGQWSTPNQLAQGRSAPSPSGLSLAVSGNGSAVLVWQANGRVVSAFRPAGSPEWSAREIVPGYRGDKAVVAIDNRGRAVLVYPQRGSIRTNRYQPGSGWDRSTLLQRGNPFTSQANVVANDRGVAVANWMRLIPIDGSDHLFRFQMRFARMTPAGRWRTHSVSLPLGSSYTVSGAGLGIHVPRYTLGIDRRGRATFAWAVGDHSVWVLRSDPDGLWAQPHRLARNLKLSWTFIESSNWPRLAVGRHGEALVTWKTRRPPERGARLEGRYLHGGAWTRVRRLSPDGVHPFTHATTIGAPGRALVAWNDLRKGIQARFLEVR